MRPSCFFAKKNNCYVKYEHEDDAAAPVRVHVAEVVRKAEFVHDLASWGIFLLLSKPPDFPPPALPAFHPRAPLYPPSLATLISSTPPLRRVPLHPIRAGRVGTGRRAVAPTTR